MYCHAPVPVSFLEGFVGEDDVGALKFVAREEVLLVDTDSVAVAFAVKKLSEKVRIEY